MTRVLRRLPWVLPFVVGVVFAFAAAGAGYKAYEYTESPEFCATCHPMKPQATVYEHQPHANVACSTCHIGPGASFFIKSKIDGTRQLLSTLTNSYDRPVPSPVKDLRPAKETCQTCHAPQKFTDNVVKIHTHFGEDEKNTETNELLVLKLGGYDRTTDQSKGIHWHIKSKVYYIAGDEQRQTMQWVGVEDENGRLTEYWSPELANARREGFVEKARTEGRMRQLDCIDCHNRAAHLIEPPATLVDKALAAGVLDRDLPHIKRESVELLSGSYPTQETGIAAMAALEQYFQTEHPEVYQQSREAIETAVQQLQAIYSRTDFPDMRLNWQTYPNNVNHREFKGCSRCHNDSLISFDPQGRTTGTVSGACNLCHSVPLVTRPGLVDGRVEPSLQAGKLEFIAKDASGALLASPDARSPIDLTGDAGAPAPLRVQGPTPGDGKVTLVGPPVVGVGLPETHEDPKWTLNHRDISEEEKATCTRCHSVEAAAPGGSFCETCHASSPPHPRDMLFTHPQVIKAEEVKGGLACSTCHQQNLSCTKCHSDRILGNSRPQQAG